MIVRTHGEIISSTTRQSFVKQCCPDPLFVTADTQLNTVVKCAQCGKSIVTIIKD